MARNDAPVIAEGEFHEDSRKFRIQVLGGLQFIKGNPAPYFTIQADISERSNEGRNRCGCCHDDIERVFPGKFTDLIALHLSYIDGTPSHHEANGFFWLAGAMGGCGERYHGGNIDPSKTQPECLETFARHCRISVEEAQKIRDACLAELGPPQESEAAPPWRKSDYARARARWASIAKTMAPRFKREADACIARHGLTVFGDDWPPARGA